MRMIFALALLGACGKSDPAVDAVLSLSGDATAGASVWITCAACHGENGEGGTGPAMTEEAGEVSDEEFVDIMIYGYEEMAPVGLEDQEMADVLAYIRATFGEYAGGE